MKTILYSALIIASFWAATLPASAGFQCYFINGKSICCSQLGNTVVCN
jgi:hypothetical protein